MDQRISHAVRDCLSECEDWSKPLPHVSAFVDRLIAQGWSCWDARQVGNYVMQLLDPDNPALKNGDGKPPPKGR